MYDGLNCRIYKPVLNYKICRFCFSYSLSRSVCVDNRVISPFAIFSDRFCEISSESISKKCHQIRCSYRYSIPVGIPVSRIGTGVNAIPVTSYQMTSRTKSDTVSIPNVLFYYREIVVINVFELFLTRHLVTGNAWRLVLLLLTLIPTVFQYWIPDRICDSDRSCDWLTNLICPSCEGDITRFITQPDRPEL